VGLRSFSGRGSHQYTDSVASQLLARLDKNGGRVLCGSISCGTQMAFIVTDTSDGAARWIGFPPGWAPHGLDQVWQPTRHAARQIAGDLPSRYRRQAQWASGRRVAGTAVEKLPAATKCPGCGFVNILCADALRAEPKPRVVASGGSSDLIAPTAWFLWRDREESAAPRRDVLE
jgi:hypothetical protein